MGRRKRLLLISQYFPMDRGGAEHQAYFLAQHLQARMDIHYLINSNEVRQWQDGPIRISAIPSRTLLRRVLGRCYVLDYFRVLEVLKRIRPDVIYVRAASAYLGIASRYARSCPCSLIWHIASAGDLQPFAVRSLRTIPFDYLDKQMIDYGIRHADYIFGQAQYQEDLLRQNYGRTCDLIVGNWHPTPTSPCLKGQRTRVVWVSNIKPLKRPETFVDLAERLRAVSDAEFIMIGRPASARYQRRLEARIQNVQGLTYLGERSNEEINRILAESHVLVNTSDYEGFPNTFVQAWLHEVPVVSLHVDPDDLLVKQGLGFHSGSLDKLVQDTRRLIENPELRTRIGAHAKGYALEHHDLAKNLHRVVEFLSRVASPDTNDV